MHQLLPMTIELTLDTHYQVVDEQGNICYPRAQGGTYFRIPPGAPEDRVQIQVGNTAGIAEEFNWAIIKKAEVLLSNQAGRMQIDRDGQPILTFGQKLVGLTFNPSGDDQVGQVKQIFAAMADRVMEAAPTEGQDRYLWNTIKGDCIRNILHTKMAVVTLLTLKY